MPCPISLVVKNGSKAFALTSDGAHRTGDWQAPQRIALRCEKKAKNLGSFVAIALGFILIKSVHTA